MRSFFTLVDRLDVAGPADRPAIEALIWDTFGVEQAVLALDMAGFSLSVRRTGVLAYLRQIRRMQRLAGPVVLAHGGAVVKFEADNLLAVFPDPAAAVAAAVGINRAVAGVPDPPAGVPLAVSVGVDYGRFLLVPGADCFGDPVNIAYKLGEDVAGAGEVLVTDAVRARLGDPPAWPLEELRLSVGGAELTAYKVRYDDPPAAG